MEPCGICTPEERAVCLCRHPEFAFFREWMASGDPLKQTHVRNRSRLPYVPPPTVPAAPTPAALPPVPAAADPRTILGSLPMAGDAVEALAKRVGADRLARWWEAKTRRSCGCQGRREALNNASRALARWAARRPRP